MSDSSYTYELPPNYRCNRPPDRSGGGSCAQTYWTPERVTLSAYYQHAVYSQARTIADNAGASTIYDIGCGPATKLLNFFDDSFTLVGVDTQEAISYCRARHSRGTFFIADLDSPEATLPNDVPPADMVICADVIEHLLHPEHLLSFIASSLGPAGIAVISTPERDALYGPGNLQPSNPEHVREWSMSELARFLVDNDMSVTHQEVVSSFRVALCPGMWRQALSCLWHRMPRRSTQIAVCTVLR